MSIRQTLLAATLLACAAIAPAGAATINFDEFAADDTNGPMAPARYAYLGVTFTSTDDGSTWGGLGNGDPGNWGLLGTNGSIFSGYNGESYGAGMLFGMAVDGVALDASRSNGSAAGNTFTLEGYLNGLLVDSETITFGDINSWSTLMLTGTIDELRWSGAGNGFHPYGIDNIRWDAASAVPEPGSLALAGLALGLLAAGARRRQR